MFIEVGRAAKLSPINDLPPTPIDCLIFTKNKDELYQNKVKWFFLLQLFPTWNRLTTTIEKPSFQAAYVSTIIQLFESLSLAVNENCFFLKSKALFDRQGNKCGA